jgi:hypothetical protein
MSPGVNILLLEIKIMETPLKNLSKPKPLTTLLKTIMTLRLNMIKPQPLDALPNEMFTYGVPYEASETCRKIRFEFENNKSLAAIEARQALCRC